MVPFSRAFLTGVGAALALLASTGCGVTDPSAEPPPSGEPPSSAPSQTPTSDAEGPGVESSAAAVGGFPSSAAAAPTGDSCPDPTGWSTRNLARFLVVPGFPGDAGVPGYINGGQAGLFVTSGWQGLATGSFTADIPDAPRPFVAIDYEGGLVARHKELLGHIPSPRDQAATMSPDQVRDLAANAGRTMRSYGITLDFAPVVDLDLGSPIVDSRSYGSDPQQVIDYAGAFSEGLRESGVQPVLKHFPGHGSADGDSHVGAVTTQPWETLRNRDVMVFTSLLKQQGPWLVMMGHLFVPGLSSSPGLPTSVDPAAYLALREETGFTGPVITDDLSRMRAILDLYTTPAAVVAAIEAGADLALLSLPEGYEESVELLAQWADGDPERIDGLRSSARRVLTILPCSTS